MDPSNAIWQRDLSISHERMGDFLQAQGDLSGALAEHRAALAISERLAAMDSSSTVQQHELWLSRLKVGSVLRAQGDLSGALTEYRAALAIAERLAAEPFSTRGQRDLWVTCWMIGDALERSSDPTALEWWQRAYGILSDMKGAGLYISPADEQYYETLRQKLGQ